ncbi:MAG: selenide, water dikinase SelD [Bacteroidota bacterium]
MNTIKLTQYSHGAGCGCKIAPGLLREMLHSTLQTPEDTRLLVGNDTSDDAAVYDVGNGVGIISTTDFFMPIVDDARTFGRIAAANAISDIYAMGGTPLMAIAIFGWPIDKLPAEVGQQVLEGGRETCLEAGMQLAGGHSIDSPEPIFGLAVTGQVPIHKLKKNSGAQPGCKLYLTKPLGVGVLTTAQKKGLLAAEHAHLASELMMQLNSIGKDLADINGVKAMTDVTGFGLLGHLRELCEGSNVSAEVSMGQLPLLQAVPEYIAQECVPGGTMRNWKSYGEHVTLHDASAKNILCDPQTSGGLLIAVSPEATHEVETLLKREGLPSQPIGELKKTNNRLIHVTA